MKEYKPFLLFLLRFFSVYGILLLVYNLYLGKYDANKNEVDAITKTVTQHTVAVLKNFDAQAHFTQNYKFPCYNVFYQGKCVVRVVEGCNAVAIIILFVAFVVAFRGSFKHTLLFILIGSLLIYIFNVMRIALLTILIYQYPEHTHLLHGVLFPLFIYGFVFLMWLIWINKFSYVKRNSSK